MTLRLFAATLLLAAPAAADVCRGSVHVIVRDGAGAVVDPSRFGTVEADPAPVLEPLALVTAPNRMGPVRERVLRLGACAFNGDVTIRRSDGRAMVLQLAGLADDNDVPYVVDGPPFKAGMFRLEFTPDTGPLVPSTNWVEVRARPLDIESAGRLERRLAAAMELGEVREIDALVAPDAYITSAEGRLVSREQWRDRLAKEGPSVVQHRFDHVVPLGGETTLVTGLTVVRRGKGPEQAFRYTRTYVNREGRWLVIAQQETAAQDFGTSVAPAVRPSPARSPRP